MTTSALRLPSEHDYGNGVAIFTRDGDTARDFTNRVQVGMVGVNFAIPVPSPTIPLAAGSGRASATSISTGPTCALLQQDQDGDVTLALWRQGRRRVRHSDDEVSAPDEDKCLGRSLDLERRPWSCAHLFRFPAPADDAAQAGSGPLSRSGRRISTPATPTRCAVVRSRPDRAVSRGNPSATTRRSAVCSSGR